MDTNHTMALPLAPQQMPDGRHKFVALMDANGDRVGTIDVKFKRMEYEAVTRAIYIANATNAHDGLVEVLKRCAFLLEISSAEIERIGESEFEYDGSTCDATGHRTDCLNAIDRAQRALKAAGVEDVP